MTLLVLGATGTLGRQIVREALNEGYQVKCLVRNIKKASFLKEWGAELIYGDLSIVETIPQALYGITVVIDAATSRASDSYNTTVIDFKAKQILIQAAEIAKIKRFIFFSFLKGENYPQIPLISLKLNIEKQLQNSSLKYTIFHIAGFFQGLISQYAIPILEKQSIWITKESAPIGYIDTQDIAKFTIKSLSIKNAEKSSFPLVGPTNWTSQEIIRLCEKLGGKKAKITRVSLSTLQILRYFTYCFEWSWNISDRLAFAEILTKKQTFSADMKPIYKIFNLVPQESNTLEKYLQEYFVKILRRVQQVNSIDNTNNNNF
uniref:Conserved hypothetical plastid protein n=1 Tax=Rhodochaete parvula TaxID=110510 RepID=A0A1X9PV33_9RHOD|nr:conserved hypothetical plastid protein [Rhodochaete parvula]ASK39593.1 hypothetical protein Rhodc_048 [Rhodochaete parvula]